MVVNIVLDNVAIWFQWSCPGNHNAVRCHCQCLDLFRWAWNCKHKI